jgi:DNA-binding NtrC family response regulator
MPRHTADEIGPRRPNNPQVSFGLSAMQVRHVEHLIGHALATIERELILQTLIHLHGNRTRAADVLGISVRSLRDRIRTYKYHGDNVPEPRPSRSDDAIQLKLPDVFH